MKLAIHEFGHSFVNHIVLSNNDLIDQTRSLFAPLKEHMAPQGYPTWKDCLIEHFVRAGEIIIPEIAGHKIQSSALIKNYRDEKKFIYLPQIIEALKQFRLDQGLSYPEAVKLSLKNLKSDTAH